MKTTVKVAIIEDDPMIHQMYRMKFEFAGYEVQVAENGDDGIKLVKVMSPDIILLDINMPNVKGDAALLEIRKHSWGKEVPVLILTNVNQQDSRIKTDEDENIAGYVLKAEFTPRQVVELVDKTLKKYGKI